MSKEISNALRNDWESAFSIAQNLEMAKIDLLVEFKQDLRTSLKEGLTLEWDVNFKKKFTGFSIFYPQWKWVNIKFEFQTNDSQMIYGFCVKSESQKQIPSDLRTNLNALTDRRLTTEGWPWYNLMEEPLDHWGKAGAYEAMMNGIMKNSILSKIEFLLDKAKTIKGL